MLSGKNRCKEVKMDEEINEVNPLEEENNRLKSELGNYKLIEILKDETLFRRQLLIAIENNNSELREIKEIMNKVNKNLVGLGKITEKKVK
jgi:hypothetical protein